MARLLKQRYFSDTNIINAIPKRRASFVWKSLLQGRDLLKRGMRFVIGDGSTISTWVDPWLPVHPPRPKQNQVDHCLLSNWILRGNKWNTDQIRELVIEEDAEIILSLKLYSSATQDFQGWHYSETGIYSVKSAYWLANQLFMDPTIQPPPPPGNARTKAKIWKIKTAPKIKHFLWQLLSEALAIGDNLRRRHIRNQPQCHRCCQDDETTQHLFFDCFYAQQVWRASGIPLQELRTIGITTATKMELLLSNIMTHQQPQFFNLAIWILWRLWKSRNQLVFQRRSISWQSTLQRA